jgi:hypothetical protein
MVPVELISRKFTDGRERTEAGKENVIHEPLHV